MYQIKNGILYRDGKPTLGIGVSYYASYHPEKRTLPPGADAIGEMRLDVRDMAQAGFNHIRTAANGAAHWEGNTFCPFIIPNTYSNEIFTCFLCILCNKVLNLWRE